MTVSVGQRSRGNKELMEQTRKETVEKKQKLKRNTRCKEDNEGNKLLILKPLKGICRRTGLLLSTSLSRIYIFFHDE